MGFVSIVIIGVLIALLALTAFVLMWLGRESSLPPSLSDGLATTQDQALQNLTEKIEQLILSNAEQHDALKEAMAGRLDELRTEVRRIQKGSTQFGA